MKREFPLAKHPCFRGKDPLVVPGPSHTVILRRKHGPLILRLRHDHTARAALPETSLK